MYKEITECRICRSTDLHEVINLGKHYVVDFVTREQVEACKAGTGEQPVPLTVLMCGGCKYVQLRESVDPDRLYKKFWYKSGINESMRASLKDIVDSAIGKIGYNSGDTVLDIGCNDGTLLSFYPHDVVKYGFDPAENLCEEAVRTANTPYIYAEYYDGRIPDDDLEYDWNGFKVITAVAMFYDLEDPNKFLQNIKRQLHKHGVFVIQMNYLPTMLRKHAVDNISHEHLGYYSLETLDKLLQQNDLEIKDATLNDVNGGSIRVFVTHAGFARRTPAEEQNVAALMLIEKAEQIGDPKTYVNFMKRIDLIVRNIHDYLTDFVNDDNRVYTYGASTRGSTLLQILNLPEGTISGAAERNPDKYGLHMVGSWVPIMSEEQARGDADLFFVLPYHFKHSILQREDFWMRSCGTPFLFPLPNPHIYRVQLI